MKNGAAASAQHEADGGQQLGQRHDQVDRRKGCFAHKVGHAQAIYDAVDGGEQHGAHGGQHEPQQARVGKVIRQLDFLLGHEKLLSTGNKTGRISSVSARPAFLFFLTTARKPPAGRCLHGILSGPSKLRWKRSSDDRKRV